MKSAHWLLVGALVCAGCPGPQSNVEDPDDGASEDGAPQPTEGETEGEGEGEGPGEDPSLGEAPDFTLKTLDGGSITLSELKGKVVLVDFWSTTCDPCLAEMPELVKLYNEKKAEGFEILAVSTDPSEKAAAVPAAVKKHKMNFPVLLDEDTEAMDRYNPKGELPFTALVNRKGQIVLKRAGYQAGDEASWKLLVDAVDKALAAK